MEINQQVFDNELIELQEFLSKTKGDELKKNFIQVADYHLDGADNKQVVGGKLEIFQGLSLDLSTARLVGRKSFFRSASAEGTGGMIRFSPPGVYSSMVFPLYKLYMQDGNIISGEAAIGDSIGLGKKNNNRLYAAYFSFKIHNNGKKNEFKFENLIFDIQNSKAKQLFGYESGEPKVEFYPEIHIDESGLINPRVESQDPAIFENHQFSQKRMQNLLNFESQNAIGKTDKEMNQYVAQAVNANTSAGKGEKTGNKSDENSGKKTNSQMSISNGQMRKKGQTGKVKTYTTLEIIQKDGKLEGTITSDGVVHLLEGIEIDEKGGFTCESVEWEENESFFQKFIKHIVEKISTKAGNVSANFVYKGLQISADGTVEYEKKLLGFSYTDDIISSENDSSASGEKGESTQKSTLSEEILAGIKEELSAYETEGESSNEANLPLFVLPFAPGISFGVYAYANYETGYNLGASLSGLNIDMNSKTIDIDGIGLGLEGSVTGSAAAGIKASLKAGQEGLATIGASLAGEISMSGTGENNELLKGTAEAELGYKDNKVSVESITLKAQAGIQLEAAIKAAVEGSFLIWKKELCSVTFDKWNLGTIKAEVEATMDVGKGKWETKAQASYKNFMGKITKKLSAKEEFEGLIQEEKKETFKVTKNLSEFKELRETLQEASVFYNNLINTKDTLIVTNDEESSYYELNQLIVKIENKFYEAGKKKGELLEKQFKLMHNISTHKVYTDTIENKKFHEQKLDHSAKLLDSIQRDPKNKLIRGEVEASREQGNSSKSKPFESKGFDKYLKEKKHAEYRSVTRLLEHEKARLKVMEEGSTSRIKTVKKFAKSNKLAKETFSVPLRDLYESLSGNWYKKNKVRFADLKKLLETEQEASKRIYTSSKYKEVSGQIQRLRDKYIKIENEGLHKAPNPEFFKEFRQGARKTAYQDGIEKFGNMDLIIGFLQGKIPESALKIEKKRDNVTASTNITKLSFYKNISKSSGSNIELYKTATRGDVIELYKEQRRKSFIKKKLADAENKQEALLELVLDRINLDVLINFEESRTTQTKESKEKLEELKIAKAHYEDRKIAVEKRCEEAIKAVKLYFYDKKIEGSTTKWTIRKDNALLKGIEEGQNAELLPDELLPEDGGQKLMENDAAAYSLMHQYSLTGDGQLNVHKNHQAMNEFLIRKKRHDNIDSEMAKRYYDYDARSESKLVNGIDYLSLLEHFKNVRRGKKTYKNEIAYLAKYPDALKGYKEYLIKNEEHFMTPEMLFSNEKTALKEVVGVNQSGMLTRAISSGEDIHEARSKYQQTAGNKLYENTEGICLRDILFVESTLSTKEMQKHRNRLEILQNSEYSDEEKIEKSQSITLQKEKEDVKKAIDAINNDPVELARELHLYEQMQVEQYKAVQEARDAEMKKMNEHINLLAAQMQQCREVSSHSEKALEDPASIFGQKAETQKYIDHVLLKSQEHLETFEEIS